MKILLSKFCMDGHIVCLPSQQVQQEGKPTGTDLALDV